MRMYWAKQRASVPVSICWLATSHDGTATSLRPASFMAFVMSVGFMSAEPTICCCLSSSLTVLRALTLITSAPMPNAIMRTPAMMPPISRALRTVIDSYLPVDFGSHTEPWYAVVVSGQGAGGIGASTPLRYGSGPLFFTDNY